MSFIKNVLTDFNTVKPAYTDTDLQIQQTSLPKEIETVIIGGGLAGLSAAHDLAEGGHPAIVLEAKKIGMGPSGRSGGQLWPGFEKSYSELADSEEGYGENYAKNVMGMVHEALATVHRRAANDPTHCDFKPGVLLVGKTGPQAEWIEEEYFAMKEAGFDWVSFVDEKTLKAKFVNSNGYYLNGMLFRGNQEGQQYGHLNPLKLTKTVAKLATDLGAQISEDSPVQKIEKRDDGKYILYTPKGEVVATNVILATGADVIRPKGVTYDQAPNGHVPVQTVILATEPIPEKLARQMVPGDACFCDAADAAMNYGRLIPADDKPGYYRLMLGGADALGQAQTAIDIIAIEKEMRAMFPQLDKSNIKVEKIWGGNCDLSREAMPYIVENDNFYAIGGFSGQGMVNTTLYGGAVAEKIMGHAEKFETLEQMNPGFYTTAERAPHWVNRALAWGHAARELLPAAYEAKQEERAELPLRKARAEGPDLESFDNDIGPT